MCPPAEDGESHASGVNGHTNGVNGTNGSKQFCLSPIEQPLSFAQVTRGIPAFTPDRTLIHTPEILTSQSATS